MAGYGDSVELSHESDGDERQQAESRHFVQIPTASDRSMLPEPQHELLIYVLREQRLQAAHSPFAAARQFGRPRASCANNPHGDCRRRTQLANQFLFVRLGRMCFMRLRWRLTIFVRQIWILLTKKKRRVDQILKNIFVQLTDVH